MDYLSLNLDAGLYGTQFTTRFFQFFSLKNLARLLPEMHAITLGKKKLLHYIWIATVNWKKKHSKILILSI